MKKSVTVFLIVFAGLFVQLSLAQESKLVSFSLDHASFAYDSENSLVEAYLGFDATSIPFQAVDGIFRAEIPVQIVINRVNDTGLESGEVEPVYADAMKLAFSAADTLGLQKGQTFVHQLRQLVPPGTYEMEVKVLPDPDLMLSEFAVVRQIAVNDFRGDSSVGLSDITLSSNIQQATDEQDAFFKSGLSVQPNPNQLFGNNLARVYYYAEGYNLESMSGDDAATSYTVLTYVAEANLPQPLPNLQSRTEKQIRTDEVFVGAFDISALPSGSYFLRLVLLNNNNEAVVEQYKKFFVYNPNVIVEAQEIDPEQEYRQSIFANMDDEEAETAVEQARMIATDQENRRLRSLKDPEDKRRFLAEFWKIRDPKPSTAVNEYYAEFNELVRYARERFHNAFTEGWKTDRGRAVLKYGIPSAIEPHMYDRESVPHEIWQYNNIPGEGQALFVFADVGGFGEIELIHSSVLGERKDPNWQARIRQ